MDCMSASNDCTLAPIDTSFDPMFCSDRHLSTVQCEQKLVDHNCANDFASFRCGKRKREKHCEKEENSQRLVIFSLVSQTEVVTQSSPTPINIQQLSHLNRPIQHRQAHYGCQPDAFDAKSEKGHFSDQNDVHANDVVDLLGGLCVKDAARESSNLSQWLYAVKCSNCLEAIGPNELVMRVHNYVYHVACFTCTRCGRQLRKGDQYTMRPGGRLICRHDLESEGQQGAMALLHGAPLAGNYPHSPATPVASGTRPSMSPGIELAMLGTSPSAAAPPQLDERCNGGKGSLAAIISPDLAYSASPRAPHNCDPSQPPLGPSSGASGPLKNEPYSPQHQHQQAGPVTQVPPPPPMKQDGRRGPKRPRTILTTAQRRAFKTSFEISQKPCRKVRETLAKETGLSVRIVQVWFQNQRAKLKKIQRKQQQQQMAHGGPGSGQGGGGLLGIGNGSESGGGIGSHSSDKSKDDSSDEEDDDGSTVAAFSLPSMHRYMMHSPDDASYYSREDDSHGGYLSVVKGSNPDTLTALDGDSETSLCELDEASMAPDSATAVAAQPPPRSSDGADLELTCLDGGELGSGMFHSPTLPPFGLHPHHHHAHLHHHQPAASQHNNMVHINLGALIPAPGATALLSVSPQVSTTTAPLPSSEGGNALMTPIDKLYSMQNSYFSNPSECEC